MSTWTEMMLLNAASATFLAGLVALVARRIRHAPVLHALWLVVLLKLISPPVFEVGLLPGGVVDGFLQRSKSESSQATVAIPGPPTASRQPGHSLRPHAAAEAAVASDTAVQVLEGSVLTASRLRVLARSIPMLALSGSLLLLGLAIGRIVRFQRRIRTAPEAPASLQERADRLARSFGLRRTPRIRMVPGRIPPSVWPGPGAGEILLPAALVTQLSEPECDALLAHEMAHVQRRDHWLRPVELLVVALYWWHPVAWWAQRNLRIAEEASCDAMVVRHLDSRPRVYVEGLLKTVEFLARTDQAVPLLATGATGTARLKERVTMILKKKTPDPLPRHVRPLLYAAMLLALLVTPAWVAKAPDGAEENAERLHQQEMLAIQKEEIQLRKQMRLLENDRRRVQLELDERMYKRQLEGMQQEIAALEEAGRKSEAEEMRRNIALMEEEATLHRKEIEMEQRLAEKRMAIEFELQELDLQRQQAESAADLDRAQELMQRAFKLEQDLRRLDLQAMQSALERQRERLELENRQLQQLEP